MHIIIKEENGFMPDTLIKIYEDRNHIVTAKDGNYDYEVLREIKEFFDGVN